jgi:hypothetical protein
LNETVSKAVLIRGRASCKWARFVMCQRELAAAR